MNKIWITYYNFRTSPSSLAGPPSHIDCFTFLFLLSPPVSHLLVLFLRFPSLSSLSCSFLPIPACFALFCSFLPILSSTFFSTRFGVEKAQMPFWNLNFGELYLSRGGGSNPLLIRDVQMGRWADVRVNEGTERNFIWLDYIGMTYLGHVR